VKLSSSLRILRDTYVAKGLRHTYWDTRAMAAEVARLAEDQNAHFRSHVLHDLRRYLLRNVRPIDDETEQRARAAAAWLLRAQKATPDDGVSLGYFPCNPNGAGWKPSYPETTGYIITSLLTFAERFDDTDARDAALRMSAWEIAVQMPSGAVQGGPVCPPDEQTPAAFNTGMVLDGWCSSYSVRQDADVLAAARRAADFLVNDLDEDGYFRTNGAFVSSGEIKTYTCLCAWAIYRAGIIAGEPRYVQGAVRSVEAALRQQRPNGWFAHNDLARSEAPLTHTIGYTLQCVLEVGLLAKREDFIAAVRLAIDNLMPHCDGDGYLAALFYDDWQPASFSSCLTGSAQIAIVAYRLFEHTNAETYRRFADRLVNYLKPLQALDSPIAALNGALAGSFPLFGAYMRGGYPNWATKYMLDALLLQDRTARR